MSDSQIRDLSALLAKKTNQPLVMPAGELLYRHGGEPKSVSEMTEIALALLQDCGGSLVPNSWVEIVAKMELTRFYSSVRLYAGQTWHVFDRGSLLVEDVKGVHNLTGHFRQLLRLPTSASLSFEHLWVRKNGGLIEIGGRVSYFRDTDKNNGFTIHINPYVDGTIPADIGLVVFK